MGRHIPTPFQLSILKDQTEENLNIETILRIVPCKRMIAVARWRDRQVIMKLFYQHGHWKRNLLRDLKGVNLLRQASIPTPDIIHQTTTADSKGAVLIIEYLRQGVSLRLLHDDAISNIEKEEVLESAIQSIARCHQAGLWQEDSHLDNFMRCKGRVYLLDGGAIRFSYNELGTETRLSNLASFFAQFPVAMDKKVPTLLQHYQKHATSLSESDLAQFAKRIIEARRNRLAKFERKLFRSTTANRCVQDISKFVIYDRSIHSTALEQFIDNPSSYIGQENLLKEGNSSTVAEVKIGSREFVLKRYNIKSFLHGLTRLLRPSRAHHSWRNAAVLVMLGIDTPRPYLFMEERVLWFFRRRAYFLCEKIDADNLVLQMQAQDSQQFSMEELMGAFKLLFEVMSDYRLSHGDMKATNFIYNDSHLYLLDLDAMRRHNSRKRYSAKITKDLARFRRNWEGTKLEPLVNQMIGEVEALQAG